MTDERAMNPELVEAEGIMRRLEALLPEGMGAVLTLIKPQTDPANPDPMRFITMANVPPEKAREAIMLVAARQITGIAIAPFNLGATQ